MEKDLNAISQDSQDKVYHHEEQIRAYSVKHTEEMRRLEIEITNRFELKRKEALDHQQREFQFQIDENSKQHMSEIHRYTDEVGRLTTSNRDCFSKIDLLTQQNQTINDYNTKFKSEIEELRTKSARETKMQKQREEQLKLQFHDELQTELSNERKHLEKEFIIEKNTLQGQVTDIKKKLLNSEQQ